MKLISGTTGLVGSHLLANLLMQNHGNIRALYRDNKSLESVKLVLSYYFDDFQNKFDSVQWYRADILDIPELEKAFEGVEVVYHCAALISFEPKDFKKMLKTNVEGTANMVNLSLQFGVSRFCHVSSIASLGRAENKKCSDENNIWNPNLKNSSYAISKNGAEIEVWRAIEEGLNAVIVNPSVIIGPGIWGSGSSKFFSSINRGMRFYSGGSTGFVGVKDLVKIMIDLVESGAKSERYIINSQNLSYKELLQMIAKNLDKKVPNIKIPKLLLYLIAQINAFLSVFGLFPIFLSRESARSASRKSCYSNDKIVAKLNFEFESIDDVIKYTAEKYKLESV